MKKATTKKATTKPPVPETSKKATTKPPVPETLKKATTQPPVPETPAEGNQGAGDEKTSGRKPKTVNVRVRNPGGLHEGDRRRNFGETFEIDEARARALGDLVETVP